MSGAEEPADRLAGRVCVVTGASKGMGRAFATALAARGARVALLARASAALDETAAALGEAGLAVPCDVADIASVDAAFAAAVAHFGRIDVVVNNAAITSLLDIEKATPQQIDREIGVNFNGAVYCTRAAIPHLRAAGGGDLVFISSESVRRPYPYLSLYAATKGAVEAFAAGLRGELREQGTRVTVLRSGAVEGSSLGKDWPTELRDDFFARAEQSGASHFTGTPATRTTMAEALIAILGLPRDVNLDLVEARGR